MSQFNASAEKGYVAAAAIADGILVKLNGSSQITPATAATDAIIGVTDGAVASGLVGNVRLRSAQGTVKIKAGAAVAVGAKVTSNGTGRGITTTTAGNEVVGLAIEAAAADGDLFEAIPSNSKF